MKNFGIPEQDKNGTYNKLNLDIDCMDIKTDKIILHMFYEHTGMDKNCTVKTSGTKCTISKINKNYDNSGNNGIEVEMTIKPEISMDTVKKVEDADYSMKIELKWEYFTWDQYDSQDENITTISMNFKNNQYLFDKAVKEEEKEKEELENDYYKKDISEIRNATADEKLKYLASIVINDKKNGNNDLWKKFVSETTPEERKNWQKTINLNNRSMEDEEKSAMKALDSQVELDKGNISQEQHEENLNQAGEELDKLIEEYNKNIAALKSLKGQISGTGFRKPAVFEDILDNVEGYNKPSDLDSATATKIETAASKVLSAITSIGVVVAIVILAVLGVKYMLGSVEEKAEYKKDLVPYLIGACLLFGISVFVKIFMQWGETLSNW